MARGKAKKAKPKTKAKAKAKPKPKAKAKPKAKSKPKSKSKPKPKPKPKTDPVTVYPDMCNSFTANNGDTVEWQEIPTNGCKIEASGTWPFNVGPPIDLPSPSTISISASSGSYEINVKCCAGEGMKTVTVP
jgi:hypothetical protein